MLLYYSNTRLTCHLGIEIPPGDVTITCGGEKRKWEQGKCVVFDDSFEHEVRGPLYPRAHKGL